MANPQNYDELNILKKHSIPFREYFADMELTPKQKKEREEFCYILEDMLIIFFSLFENGVRPDETYVKQELTYSVYDAIEDKNFFGKPEELDKYVSGFVNETYKSTVENLEKTPNDYDYTGEQQYWISDDRADFIAENESNTLFNSKEYVEALKAGKRNKIWKSYWDDKVRPTHVEVDVTMLPINEYFTVGAALMLYPKDTTSEFSTGAEHLEEVINCRCQCIYV